MDFSLSEEQQLLKDSITTFVDKDYLFDVRQKNIKTELGFSSDFWKTFADLGLSIPGGSDCPIEDGNPMFEYYAAITRKDHDGFPENGWHPEEALDRISALKMFTQWAAYGEFSEGRRGTIKIGNDADFTVLNNDITCCPPNEILDTEVMMTIVDGETVYSKL